jgi:hypothetical protein
MRDEMNVLFGDLDYYRNNTKGSAMYFDPVQLSRQQFAWVIAWHNHTMATMATFIQTPAAAWSLSRSIDHAAPISSAQRRGISGD